MSEPINFNFKKSNPDREVYEAKKRARLKRRCKGHWIVKNKIRNYNCYEDGICLICGGLQ